MAAISWAEEFLFLEIEGGFEQFEPFIELEALEIFEVDATEPRPSEPARWGYRIPCPGVRYYFFE